MRTHQSTHCGSRFRTGSHFVPAVLLAVLVMLGMLAMHGITAVGAAAQQSPTAPASSMHAASASPQSAGSPQAAAKAGHALGQPPAPAAWCANCSAGELSMAANCGAAVVPGPDVLPMGRAPGSSRRVQTGPKLPAGDFAATPRPSLTLLCINRC